MANESWYTFPLKDGEDGEAEPVKVVTRSVHPLLPVSVAGRGKKRPKPEKITIPAGPGGKAMEESNVNDPAYKEKVKAWRRELSDDVARMMLSQGVTEETQAALADRSTEELASLLNEIQSKSFPTEDGVAAASAILTPIEVEGLIAAKFFGLSDPRIYFAMDAAMKNYLIAAFRFAQDNMGGPKQRATAPPPMPAQAEPAPVFKTTQLPENW